MGVNERLILVLLSRYWPCFGVKSRRESPDACADTQARVTATQKSYMGPANLAGALSQKFATSRRGSQENEIRLRLENKAGLRNPAFSITDLD